MLDFNNSNDPQSRLNNLISEIETRRGKMVDIPTPMSELKFETYLQPFTDREEWTSRVVREATHGDNTQMVALNDVSFNQFADNAGIDSRTAKRLQQNYPTEFDNLINAVHQKENKPKLLRTYDAGSYAGEDHLTGRALLSDRYKTFDHAHLLASSVLPILDADAGFELVNYHITERKLYARFKARNHTGEGANVGDIMANGLGVQNSETGHGSVSVYQMYWTLACLNGMETENKIRKAHITSARETESWSILSEDAKAADNKALELAIESHVKHFSNREKFDEVLEKVRAAGTDTVKCDTTTAVDNLSKVMQFTKAESKNVLEGLMSTLQQRGFVGQPVSRATLMNAVTAVSNFDEISDDDRSEWQRKGGQVLNLNPSDWSRVAAA
jgi:ferritin-like metal-binding protein YciE|tara:strand:- start:2034 stop:3194 length:1161 start_codon:yes stop_codon:yes gene_type:complete